MSKYTRLCVAVLVLHAVVLNVACCHTLTVLLYFSVLTQQQSVGLIHSNYHGKYPALPNPRCCLIGLASRSISAAQPSIAFTRYTLAQRQCCFHPCLMLLACSNGPLLISSGTRLWPATTALPRWRVWLLLHWDTGPSQYMEVRSCSLV